MPYSSGENSDFVVNMVTKVIKPESILDVGVGSGTYANLLRPHYDGRIDGIEVWKPYVKTFQLDDKYDELFLGDVRHMHFLDYGLVIFGDVLEHMTLDDAKRVWWEYAGEWAGWGMISVPIVHYPQGAEFGNPYEEHVQDHLTVEDIVEHFGPFDHYEVYDVTATFFKEF